MKQMDYKISHGELILRNRIEMMTLMYFELIKMGLLLHFFTMFIYY